MSGPVRGLKVLSLLGLGMGLLACSPWPDLQPTPRIPADSRLGVVLVEMSPRRGVSVDARWAREALYCAVWQGAGLDLQNWQSAGSQLRIFRVNPDNLELTTLPAPPGAPDEKAKFLSTAPGKGALIVTSGNVPALSYWDKSQWHALP